MYNTKALGKISTTCKVLTTPLRYPGKYEERDETRSGEIGSQPLEIPWLSRPLPTIAARGGSQPNSHQRQHRYRVQMDKCCDKYDTDDRGLACRNILKEVAGS